MLLFLSIIFPGRQYDKDGNLRQWWNNETIAAFRVRAQCIIDQYSGFKLEPFGYHVRQNLSFEHQVVFMGPHMLQILSGIQLH